MSSTVNVNSLNPKVAQVMSERAIIESKRHMVLLGHAEIETLGKNRGTTVRFETFDFGGVITSPATYELCASGSVINDGFVDIQTQRYVNFYRTKKEAIDIRQGNTRMKLTLGAGKNMGQSIEAIGHASLLGDDNIAIYRSHGVASDDLVVSGVVASELLEIVDNFRTNTLEPITPQVDSDPGYGTTPVHESYVAIVPSHVVRDVMALEDFEDVEKYQTKVGNQILPKEFGRLKGSKLRFQEGGDWVRAAGAGGTNSAMQSTDNRVDVHTIFLLSKGAYGYVPFDSGSGKEKIDEDYKSKVFYREGGDMADPAALQAAFGWSARLGFGILRAKGVVAYKCAASKRNINL